MSRTMKIRSAIIGLTAGAMCASLPAVADTASGYSSARSGYVSAVSDHATAAKGMVAGGTSAKAAVSSRGSGAKARVSSRAAGAKANVSRGTSSRSKFKSKRKRFRR